jgi:hypothetical protein
VIFTRLTDTLVDIDFTVPPEKPDFTITIISIHSIFTEFCAALVTVILAVVHKFQTKLSGVSRSAFAIKITRQIYTELDVRRKSQIDCYPFIRHWVDFSGFRVARRRVTRRDRDFASFTSEFCGADAFERPVEIHTS